MKNRELEVKVRELEERVAHLEREVKRKHFPVPYPVPMPAPEKPYKPWKITQWMSKQ